MLLRPLPLLPNLLALVQLFAVTLIVTQAQGGHGCCQMAALLLTPSLPVDRTTPISFASLHASTTERELQNLWTDTVCHRTRKKIASRSLLWDKCASNNTPKGKCAVRNTSEEGVHCNVHDEMEPQAFSDVKNFNIPCIFNVPQLKPPSAGVCQEFRHKV